VAGSQACHAIAVGGDIPRQRRHAPVQALSLRSAPVLKKRYFAFAQSGLAFPATQSRIVFESVLLFFGSLPDANTSRA
jgi:hypothetical protein